MQDDGRIQKIDLEKVDWRGSREFFESLGEALDKLDDKDEAYDFTWVGKRKAIIEAGAPINKTFRPNIENSKNWDTTENLFIEGDNLDALKLLQESYLGKVKMIYIDPPYNTGKDFVYHDNFKVSPEQYDEDTDYKDDEGNIQFKKNEKTNGRYHSDWLTMMYPRLKLARNLLTDDGVIFMSIDDNEQANLKKLSDEIFGEDNFIGIFKWNRVAKAPSLSDTIRTKYEYVLCYKRAEHRKFFGKKSYNTQAPVWHNPNKQQELKFPAMSIRVPSSFAKGMTSDKYKVELLDDIIEEDGLNKEPVRIKACSAWGQDKINSYVEAGYTFQIKKDIGTLYADLMGDTFVAPSDLISRDECGVENNTDASAAMEKLGLPFTNPKPVSLVQYLLNMVTYDQHDALVVDFFSGSGTTAHATMQLNTQDGGRRKWIMVQLPEETGKKSEAFKAGYKTIPEISRERIRRAGGKIAAEHPGAKVDYGFRSLVIDDTNYEEVYKSAGDVQQSMLDGLVDNVKEDRSDLDLLYGVLTQSALELNRPIEKRAIDGSEAYLYDYFGEVSGLVACFAESVSEEAIKEIAKLKPLTAVFRESSFANSQAKVNLAEHFRILSPETKVKVI
ncbi:MAG: site-specific DNA-methyltransferase [Candidatus Saccharimonadota bacterium]